MDNSCPKAFDLLKQAFTIAPVLLHPDPTKPFEVKMDASDFVIGVILSQPDEVSVLHPVAYYSHKFTAPEINYPIYDKELHAIIVAFEEWRLLFGRGTTPYPSGYPSQKPNILFYHMNLKL